MKLLSIVIPVWNKFNFTKSCLKDLEQLPDDHEIIIVDNGSSDETQLNLESNTRIVYHRLPNNLGFSQGCNIGYGLASAPNVLFLNNDIRVQSRYTDWTAPLLAHCHEGLVGPTMGQLDSNLNFVQEANNLLVGSYTYMSGWCLASSKNIWEELKLERSDVGNLIPQIFSEEFGPAYFEDTDLSFRARKQGIPFKVVPVPVFHFGKQTSKQLNTHMLYNNARQIFVNKWGKR
jgi:O-antigen biosynthesis protein